MGVRCSMGEKLVCLGGGEGWMLGGGIGGRGGWFGVWDV